MFSIVTKIKYEYAHRLILHQGQCRNVHGHSGEVTVELCAEQLNENGFVMDFADVKAPLKQWINDHWDHAYLANEADPLLPSLRAQEVKVFCFPAEPSAEVMARYLYEYLAQLPLPEGVSIKRITVLETCTGSAIYEPSKA